MIGVRAALWVALLLVPLAARADPISVTVFLIEAGVASGAAAAIGSIAGIVAANAWTLGFIGLQVVGGAINRRKARGAAARARAEANSRLEDRSATLLQAVPPWRVIYGRAIVGGDIVAIFTSDKTGYREDGSTYTKPDALKHLVIVLAAHEVQAINEVYIEGVALGTLDVDGWVTGGEFYAEGRPDTRSVFVGPSASLNVPEAVVTVLHSYYTTGVGVDTLYVDVTPTLSVANTRITNPNPDYGIQVDYTIAHDSTRKASVRVSKHLGTASQTVDTYLNGVAPSQWTSNHRLRGLAYVVVTLDLEEPRFQGGPPQMTFDVSGKKVLDTRTSTTAWSQNPALIVRDWLTSPWGYEVDAADIDVAACNAAANACDALINLTVGGVTTTNQPTYTCNGAFTAADGREAVLEDLVESMAGFASYGATWRIVAGAWTASVMDLGDDDLDGQIDLVQAGAGMDAIFNGVRGSYIAAGKSTPTDFDSYQNATFVTADGRELWQDVALPFTDNRARARNLSRIFVERNRDSLVIRYPAKLKAWPLQVGDRVRVTSTEYGFAAKEFRVTDWQFGTSSAVQLTLQEDAAAIYDLADAASADPSPNTGLPDPWVVAALSSVTALSNSTTVQISAGSAIVPRVLVSWAAVTDAYVADGGGRIEILWRRPGGPWQQVNVPGDSASVYLVGPNHGDRIVIEARARNSLGKLGDSTFVGHTVSGAALFGATDPGSFFDGFEDAQTLDRWRNYTGSGERTVVSVIDAGSGGNILRVGNNSGNDQAWLIHGGNIPFDPTALYRVKARIRRTAGTGTVYVGLAGVAADGTSFVNRSGSNSYSTQHYFAASGAAPASSWTEYTGYVRGTAATGTGGSACTDPSAPGVMHQDVRYIRPLAVVNYNGAAGTTEVDFISVERLGGQIGTGDLGDDAATELLTDQYDFGGTGYGTTTVRTVSFTPAADCRIEIAATIVASGLDGDGGRTVTWYVSVGGGSDTALLGFAAYSTAKQSIAAVTDYAASAGVALDFKLKTHINFAEPSIYLYDSTLRLTAVKK